MHHYTCLSTLPAVCMAKLGVDFDALSIITHAYQPCLLQVQEAHLYSTQSTDLPRDGT